MALVLICVLPGLNAQKVDFERVFYEAYISGHMADWVAGMKQLEADVTAFRVEDGLFELTLAHYGYIGYCIGNDRKKEARQYLKQGAEYLSLFMEKFPNRPEAYAFKSGFYGFEMGLAGYKALVLGPRSVAALNNAAALDSSNVYYLVEKGNQMFYMPAFIGGDKQVALHFYSRAVERMEGEKSFGKKNWYYLNILVVLAQSYEATGQIKEALGVFKKILAFEPEFQWVRDELFPDFLARHQLSG